MFFAFFFSSRRRHTRSYGDWSSDVCSSDLLERGIRFLFLIFSGGGRGRNRREIYSQRQARAGENQSKERSGRCGHRREAKTKAGCAEIPRLHGVLLRFLRPTGERRAGLTV